MTTEEPTAGPPALREFIWTALGGTENDASIEKIELQCGLEKITFESLTQAYENDCLPSLLQSLNIPPGNRIRLMQGVIDFQENKLSVVNQRRKSIISPTAERETYRTLEI